MEEGEVAVAVKILDEAGGVDEEVKVMPLTAAEATTVGATASGDRDTAVREDGSGADASVVVGVVEGAPVVVKPAPMA